MLLKFSVTNFYSIKDTLTVDFEAARIFTEKAKALADNVFCTDGKKVLKSIGIFGPNASGKSSIFKALLFCTQMILKSHVNNEGGVFNFAPFKFDGFHEKPSEFSISFVCDGTEYEYSFSLNRKEIISESLYHYPGKRRAKVFTRKEQVGKPKSEIFSFGDGLFVKPLDVAQSTGRNTLFISRASQMDRELAKKIYRFFLTEFYVGVPQVPDEYAVQLFSENKRLLLEALRMADSDIVDIEVRREQVNVPVPPAYMQLGRNVIPSLPAVGTETVTRFLTMHKRNPAVKFDLFSEESDGTIRLFYLLLALLDVCRRGKTIVVDEFDLSFHTELSDFIINLVHASKGAQFLFTSHNTNLIDIKKFRRDQICFTNKREDGSTDFYSLFDFKDFRENMDAEKGYLQGRFDAVPYTASSVAEIKKLFRG